MERERWGSDAGTVSKTSRCGLLVAVLFAAVLVAGAGIGAVGAAETTDGPDVSVVSVDAEEVTVGETGEISVLVQNVGDAAGDVSVTLSVANETQSESVELGPTHIGSVTFEWEPEPEQVGEHAVTVETPTDSGSDTVTVSESDERTTFSAIGVSGFVTINEEDPEDGLQVNFPEPHEVDDPIAINGEVLPDGTWRSTEVTFPDIDADDFDAVPIDIGLEPVGAFEGDIDREAGIFTVAGLLQVEASGTTIQVGAELTTEQSNGMEGETVGLDTESATLRVVDNEFTVDETTGTIIDSLLDLPADEPGTNWFQIELDMTFGTGDGAGEAETGHVGGTVESEDGDPLANASIDVQGEETTTAEDGSYWFAVPAGNQTVTVDAPGYAPTEESVTIPADGHTTVDAVLAEGEPAFSVDFAPEDVEAGETATIPVTVQNVGDADGSDEVTIAVGDEVWTETVELNESATETIEVTWDTAGVEEREYDVVVSTAYEENRQPLRVGEFDAEDADFIARGLGGYITFDWDTYEEAHGEGLAFRDYREVGADNAIQIAGVIDEEAGTWESVRTSFPPLQDEETGLEGFIRVPDGFEGQIDMEEGIMTASAEVIVYVEGDADTTFTFGIDLTTEDSGAITTGEVRHDAVDDDDIVEAHMVDNDFPVDDQTGSGAIDAELNLPSPDSERNFVELGFEVDFDPDGLFEEHDGEITESPDPHHSTVTLLGLFVGVGGFGLAGVLGGTGLYLRSTGRVDTSVEPKK